MSSNELIIEGPEEVVKSQPITYSVNFIPGATYNWHAEQGDIVTGQGGTMVTVVFNVEGQKNLVVSATKSGMPEDVGERIIIVDNNDGGGRPKA